MNARALKKALIAAHVPVRRCWHQSWKYAGRVYHIEVDATGQTAAEVRRLRAQAVAIAEGHVPAGIQIHVTTVGFTLEEYARVKAMLEDDSVER